MEKSRIFLEQKIILCKTSSVGFEPDDSGVIRYLII